MQILPDKLVYDSYAYFRLCSDYSLNGNTKVKPSLKMLSLLSKTDISEIADLSHKEAVALMLPKISPKYRNQVAAIEDTLDSRYKIDADCEDDELINKTTYGLYQILNFTPKDCYRNLQIRQEVYSHLYDLSELRSPSSQGYRFNILKRMVNEVPKDNNGDYDYNPLNIAARRTDYFMKKISPHERLRLINLINAKTHDRNLYNYSRQIAELDNKCFIAMQEEKLELKENNQARYDQIRAHDLPQAETTSEKIELYNELLGLVNSQDWGRGRKFSEKKTICNHLIDLYRQKGMIPEMEKAKEERDKYLNARKICSEAARLKGYKSGKER